MISLAESLEIVTFIKLHGRPTRKWKSKVEMEMVNRDRRPKDVLVGRGGKVDVYLLNFIGTKFVHRCLSNLFGIACTQICTHQHNRVFILLHTTSKVSCSIHLFLNKFL